MSHSRRLTVTVAGTDYYEGRVATIKSTMLGREDHGIPTAVLHLEGAGWGVGAGGYALGGGYAMPHLLEIMRVVGVSEWEKLPGRQVVALFSDALCAGLAHVQDEDRVMIFAEHSRSWRAEHPEPE